MQTLRRKDTQLLLLTWQAPVSPTAAASSARRRGADERPRGGGRGSGGGGAAAPPARERRQPPPAAEPSYHHTVAKRLFTAEVELASAQPVWRCSAGLFDTKRHSPALCFLQQTIQVGGMTGGVLLQVHRPDRQGPGAVLPCGHDRVVQGGARSQPTISCMSPRALKVLLCHLPCRCSLVNSVLVSLWHTGLPEGHGAADHRPCALRLLWPSLPTPALPCLTVGTLLFKINNSSPVLTVMSACCVLHTVERWSDFGPTRCCLRTGG